MNAARAPGVASSAAFRDSGVTPCAMPSTGSYCGATHVGRPPLSTKPSITEAWQLRCTTTGAPSGASARHTAWFLTNGATQGNHAVCLALAPLGARVVVQRNCHASVIDGLVLSGGLPTWVAPQYEPGLGMAHGITPESLKAALEATPGARAAFIVSPTYYGMAADVEACAEVAHAAGVPLVVDQSWGPHLGFHDELPASALALGADVMLTSVHKIAGSLTQSALLHVSDSGRVSPDAIARTLRLVRSTSPSSLLMASLDGARLHGASDPAFGTIHVLAQ